MAAFDLPLNNPELFSLSLRPHRAPRKRPPPGAMIHPDLSSTSPRNPTNTTSTTMPSSSSLPSAAAAGTATPELSSTTVSTSTSAHNNGNGGGATASSASALASVGAAASPTDVLLTLPPPVLRLLVVSAPFVQFLTTITQLLTWTHPNRFAPFFLPLFWILVTLGGETTLRYGANALLLLVVAAGWVATRGGRRYNSAMTREAHRESHVKTLALATGNQPAIQVLTPAALNTLLFQATLLSKHLQALHRTFSPILTPFTWTDPSLSWATINLLLTSYPFYLLLTYFVPLRNILMLLGLVALLWEAPWFAVVRRALWSSLLFRRTVRVILRILQGDIRVARMEATDGQPGVGVVAKLKTLRYITVNGSGSVATHPPRRPSRSSKQGEGGLDSYSSESELMEIQYLFTIFENQVSWGSCVCKCNNHDLSEAIREARLRGSATVLISPLTSRLYGTHHTTALVDRPRVDSSSPPQRTAELV